MCAHASGWPADLPVSMQDLVCYLRFASNPNDIVAFERAVANPARGIGDAALKHIRDAHAALRSGKTTVRSALPGLLGLLDDVCDGAP